MISQAHVMECEKLLEELYDMLINEILTPDNASIFYLDAIAVSYNLQFILMILFYSLDLKDWRSLVSKLSSSISTKLSTMKRV